MPWSNQGGGPWGSGGGGGGGRGPWGQGPQQSGGGSTPPDLEELLRRSKEQFRSVLPGGGFGGMGFVIVGLVVALALAYGTFFRVQPDEYGVVLRFGKYVRDAGPGLNIQWPYPIETVLLPKVTRVNRIDVGMRTVEDLRRGSTVRDVPEESLMLTGDENIVDVDFTVLWIIKPNGAADYLFNIQQADGTVKAVAESAMREIIGRSDSSRIQTTERQKIEAAVQELMQKILDSYRAGVQITQVQLQKVDPPAQVIDSLRDVQAARIDQERAQNEAQTYANRVVPEARGRAAQIIQSAEAYREQTVAEARGQTARFLKVYDEYKKAPEVTRQRIYYETMERLLGSNHTIIVDTGAASGVVPFLPLDQFARPQQPQPKAAPQQPQPKAEAPDENNLAGGIIAVIVVAVLVLAYGSMFTVYQTRQAIVVQLGEPVRVITDPGLHFKWPFIESVIHIDKRILDLENPAQEVIASDQKRLVVDAFARYRITAPLVFYQTVGSVEGANSRLSTLLNSALRRVLGENTLTHVVRDDRAALMTKVRDLLHTEAKDFGIEVVDVRIRRADLPDQNSQAVYQRMQTERQREAAEARAQGSERAQEIRARADRDVTVLLATAQATADTVRGEGDGERNRIFADAFGRDPDFFSFYRAMQAYEAALKGDTRMLLKPDSDFFRYFVDPSGRPRPGTGQPPAAAGTSQSSDTIGAQPGPPGPR